MVEMVEESWIEVFIDVILIPQTGSSDPFSVRVMAQPGLRRWIKLRPVIVAQKGDRVSLDIATPAFRSRIVEYRDPQKWHVTDGLADLTLKRKFAASYIAFRCAAMTPGRKIQFVAANERRPDDEPENRPPMISTARAWLALVL
ncbi:hypothetical protein [Bradyrhizobium elkanii]